MEQIKLQTKQPNMEAKKIPSKFSKISSMAKWGHFVNCRLVGTFFFSRGRPAGEIPGSPLVLVQGIFQIREAYFIDFTLIHLLVEDEETQKWFLETLKIAVNKCLLEDTMNEQMPFSLIFHDFPAGKGGLATRKMTCSILGKMSLEPSWWACRPLTSSGFTGHKSLRAFFF